MNHEEVPLDGDGRITRARRWPCQRCGEVYRANELLDHLLAVHLDPSPGQEAVTTGELVTAAIALLPAAQAQEFFAWCIRAAQDPSRGTAAAQVLASFTEFDEEANPDPVGPAMRRCDADDQAELIYIFQTMRERCQAAGQGDLARLWETMLRLIRVTP